MNKHLKYSIIPPFLKKLPGCAVCTEPGAKRLLFFNQLVAKLFRDHAKSRFSLFVRRRSTWTIVHGTIARQAHQHLSGMSNITLCCLLGSKFQVNSRTKLNLHFSSSPLPPSGIKKSSASPLWA